MTRWQCRGCALIAGPCVMIVYENQRLYPAVCPITGVNKVFIELTDEDVV